jgi:hypothetical protein
MKAVLRLLAIPLVATIVNMATTTNALAAGRALSSQAGHTEVLTPLTNQDIIELAALGLSDEVILEKIKASPRTQFDTSVEAIRALKGAQVSDAVLKAMIATGATAHNSATTDRGGRRGQNASQNPLQPREVKGGILDVIKLYVEKAPSATVIAVRPFSAADADIVYGEKKEETKTVQAAGPRLLAERLVTELKRNGHFQDTILLDGNEEAPAGAIIVTGKFVELDPGSRAKRYFVGFGSGKSAVRVQGTITASDGSLLTTFEHRRIGVMGMAGGDSLGKLTSDARSIGEDIAKFISAWASGKKLDD